MERPDRAEAELCGGEQCSMAQLTARSQLSAYTGPAPPHCNHSCPHKAVLTHMLSYTHLFSYSCPHTAACLHIAVLIQLSTHSCPLRLSCHYTHIFPCTAQLLNISVLQQSTFLRHLSPYTQLSLHSCPQTCVQQIAVLKQPFSPINVPGSMAPVNIGQQFVLG